MKALILPQGPAYRWPRKDAWTPFKAGARIAPNCGVGVVPARFHKPGPMVRFHPPQPMGRNRVWREPTRGVGPPIYE